MANPQYVYHMHKLSKTYPGGKQVLKDISLSFFPGAKIGVVGLNGAGKSTLLKIMAGDRRTTSARPGPRTAFASAICLRSPSSMLPRMCLAMPWRAWRTRRRWLIATTRLATNYSDETAEEMARLQDEIEAQVCGTSTPRWSRRSMPCAARPGSGREHAVGRREAARGPDQVAARQARHPAAGRADQPFGRGIGGLVGAISQASIPAASCW